MIKDPQKTTKALQKYAKSNAVSAFAAYVRDATKNLDISNDVNSSEIIDEAAAGMYRELTAYGNTYFEPLAPKGAFNERELSRIACKALSFFYRDVYELAAHWRSAITFE